MADLPMWRKYGKVNKYISLKSVIEINSSIVHLFAAKVGARGNCSRWFYVVLNA